MSVLPGGVAAFVARRAAVAPDHPAMICDGTVIRYGDLWADCQDLAAALASAGVNKGDRVAICLSRKADFATAAVAIMGYGAVLVPIDVTGAADQAFILDDSGACAVVHDAGLALSPDDRPRLARLAMPTGAGTRWSGWPQLADHDPAAINYTSGTGHRRKGVLLSHGALMASADYINSYFGYGPEVVEYVAAPLDHAFGFCRFRCVFAAGGTMVSDSGTYNAAKAVHSMRATNCNALTGPAACIAVLVERFEDGLAEFSGKIRWMEIGSQTLRAEYKAVLRRLFPDAIMVQNYGMTEAVRCTFVDFNADAAHTHTAGRPLRGVELRITGEDGQVLGTGEPGVIEVRGPQLALGYWGNQDAWNARMVDGWFQSDDLGKTDADGYLIYISRRDDMINLSGEKIAPTDVEDGLRPGLDGLSFCVCALTDPDKVRGEIPALVFEGDLGPDFSWPARRRQLVGLIPNKLLPKLAFRVADFPRTHLGKIQRKKLRAQLEAGQAAGL